MAVISDISPPRPKTRPARVIWDRALKLHTSAFMSGRIELALPCYRLPLPVFIEDRMVVIQTEQHFVEMIGGYRHYVLKNGLTRVRGELLSESDEGGHMLVDTRFTFDYFDGRSNSADSTRYIRMNGDRPVVEMLEIKTFPHRGTLAPE